MKTSTNIDMMPTLLIIGTAILSVALAIRQIRKRMEEGGSNQAVRGSAEEFIIQCYPFLDLSQAQSLLQECGLAQPNAPLSNRDVVQAIQHAVDVMESRPTNCKNLVIECYCCYDEVSIGEMVSCRDAGHFVCKDCVRRFAEEQVFGNGNLGTEKKTGRLSTELSCLAPGCSSCFTETQLASTLSGILHQRYSELQGSLNVEKAKLGDLCSCPKCHFKCVLSPEQTVLSCPECSLRSCRKCQQEYHAEKTCEEAREKRCDDARQQMEEAMTAALIRKCPTCDRELLKNEGCNKLTCPCGTILCNVCKATIGDYSHFCQTFNCNHSKCGKCSLWASTEKEDAGAIKKAKKQAQIEAQRRGLDIPSSISRDLHRGNDRRSRRRFWLPLR